MEAMSDEVQIPEVTLSRELLDADGTLAAPRLLAALGVLRSVSEGRRVVEQGAVSVGPDREAVSDAAARIAVADGLIIRVGKRKIARVRLV